MNEILTINYESENPTVSARELHEKLHIGTKFTTWFERMKEYGFSEGKEFFPKLGETSEQGGRPQTDFEISVDMAKASLRRMAQKVNDIGATAKAALNKQIDAFARLNSQYDSQSEKIDALKRKIAGYSDEYGEMQAKIDETVKKLNDLEMMQGVIKDAVKDSAKRGTTFDTTQYKWVQEDIEKLTKEIEVAEREQDKLFATGNPFELGSKARAAKEDLEKLSQEEGKLADMHNKLQTAYDGVNDKINEYSQKADEATASTSRLSRIGGMVGKAIGSIATFGKNAAKSLTGAKKSSSGFGLSLGTLVKYGFGIRSLYVLVNKLRSALVDGFKNLSQYSGETNGSISMLWSSLERLKNSLATAFAPILTVVAPMRLDQSPEHWQG